MKRLTLSCKFAVNFCVVLTLFATYSAALNELQFDNGNFNVNWSYLPASQEIEFEVRVKATGYVALGLTKTNSGMQNLDLFAGGVDSSGNNYLKDYKATAKAPPPEDSQQDYTLLSASQANGVTTVRCKRKLNTQDANDQLIEPGVPLYIAWAYHSSSDTFERHSSRGYSSQMHVLVPVMTPSPSPTVGPMSGAITIVAPTTSQAPSPLVTVSPTTKPPDNGYNKKLSFNNGDYLFYWKFDSNTNELFFKLAVKAAGWVGLGISNTNSDMKDMDVVVAGVSGGQGYIGDYYSNAKDVPPRDTKENYILRNATETGGTTTVEFKRKINTEDDKDLQIVPGEPYYIAWAYHSSSDNLTYHSQRGYSPNKVTLAAKSTVTTQKPTPTTGSAGMATYSVMVVILSLVYTLIFH